MNPRMILFAAAVLSLAMSVTARDDEWLCKAMEQLLIYPNIRLAEWIGYPQGWDMPDDLGDVSIVLPIVEDYEAIYLLKYSASRQELWLWPFRSMKVTTDQNGDWEGTHDFCPPLIVDLTYSSE